MDQKVYGAFGILFAAFAIMTWFIIPQPPSEALVGVRFRSAQYISAYEFRAQLGVPAGTTLNVFEATLIDGTSQQRAYVTFKDRPPRYLGPLKRQLGDAPVDTIFVRAGHQRIIMGRIDKGVAGHEPYIKFGGADFNPLGRNQVLLWGNSHRRSFYTIIPEQEAERWRSITRVFIWSQAALNRSSARAGPHGRDAGTLDEERDSDWIERFNPPLDMESLFIRIDDPAAAYQPTHK